jgi:hypothetical protein
MMCIAFTCEEEFAGEVGTVAAISGEWIFAM